MFDESLARIHAHRNNIRRYRRLVRTKLSDQEREFIERRLGEERTRMEALAPKSSRSHSRRGRSLPQGREPSHDRRSTICGHLRSVPPPRNRI